MKNPTTKELNISCWSLAYVSYLIINNISKGVFGILFCLDLELFAKIKKNLVSADTQKPGFLHFLWITQDLNKIKKTEHPFEDIMLSSSFYS